jgi:DNA-binding transcriptional regulator YbjK
MLLHRQDTDHAAARPAGLPRRLALLQGLGDVIDAAGAPGGDHRHLHRIGNGPVSSRS